ncbi:alpha/beta hydrolase [Aspergillus undulatus]|uniref:alpha/beta hydrolase n=1 Tax=Aspergillus undulatus TaxID=1810928 RepID=UPI003CCDD134
MSFKHTLLQELLLITCASTSLSSLSSPARLRTRQTEGVSWASCQEKVLAVVQCANFTVPLDYSDPGSDEMLTLQLVKIPATVTPKKGTVFFNFGGPGAEARGTLAANVRIFHALTSGEYDLVAFDPRGTANTLTANCSNTPEEREQYVGVPMSVAPDTEDVLALGSLWGQVQIIENRCYNYPGFRERGSLMGTTFVARDIMQVVDAIEEDGLLRYYGASYGTVIGATLATMFPERIDRMVYDGVVNPHQYFNSYDLEGWEDWDRIFRSVLEECLKAPNLCPLAHRRDNVADIERDIYKLLAQLRIEPIVAGTLLIYSSLVKTYLRFSLYSPPYTALTAGLEALLSGDATSFAEKYNRTLFFCADKKLPEQTLVEMEPDLKAFEKASRLLGDAAFIQAMICQHWRILSKERHEGDFNVATRNPMLIIGNTYDPVTPLRSAKNLTASFQNGVLLEHGGFGHGITAQGSTCTIYAIRSYFQDGTLPEPGIVCETDYSPYDPESITTVPEGLGYMEGQ